MSCSRLTRIQQIDSVLINTFPLLLIFKSLPCSPICFDRVVRCSLVSLFKQMYHKIVINQIPKTYGDLSQVFNKKIFTWNLCELLPATTRAWSVRSTTELPSRKLPSFLLVFHSCVHSFRVCEYSLGNTKFRSIRVLLIAQ